MLWIHWKGDEPLGSGLPPTLAPAGEAREKRLPCHKTRDGKRERDEPMVGYGKVRRLEEGGWFMSKATM